MTNIIAGTAGHIDHGKTALIRALTGIDTDRLEEEKRRGISIDLGFAPLAVGGFHFGFVDVPGHERFVRNMLAGVGGIDMVLLVVSAAEGVKPQTREHFDICRLLGVQHGLIALTKSDLVDAAALEDTRMGVAEFVSGSFLEGAPIIPVSIMTGDGLDALRRALVEIASRVRQRPVDGPCRLPIDRAFTMRGFGAVATGTLWSGCMHPGDEVELHPSGRRLRVRGVQVHGGSVDEATAGQRTAVNLAGIDTADLKRGMTLTPSGMFAPVQIVDCAFTLLPDAAPLKHRAPVHFHAGTAETVAEVRLLEHLTPLDPSGTAFVRLVLKEPQLLFPGDRFIARMFSPVVTIGGGTVLDLLPDNAPPLKLRRRDAAARLAALAAASSGGRISQIVSEYPNGLSVRTLVARTGELPGTLTALAERAGFVQIHASEPWLIAPSALARHSDALRESLTAFHKANPLLQGMARAGAVLEPFILDAVLERTPEVVADGELLRLASHKLQLKSEEDEAIARIESLFHDAGLAVPSIDDVLAQSGLDPARARSLLQILLRQQRLVRISADLIYHADALDQLKALLAARKGTAFTVAEFKSWTGVSRKYAIPLLEYLDRLRLTRRAGDSRMVL